MDIFQTILPIATLILGYFLNVWVGSIESKREIARRRIAEKEKSYAEITSKLHELFEAHRIDILRRNSKEISRFFSSEKSEKPEQSLQTQKYDELENLVYKHSLYLKPSIIQSLMDLKKTSFRKSVPVMLSHTKSPKEKAQFLEQHADEMWAQAKLIISEMREELGLEKYPKDLLNLWR